MKVISFAQDDDGGQSVKWFIAEGNHRTLVATATATSVELFDVPELIRARIVDAAWGAHRELAGDPHADIRHYATNRDGE